jgi:hypothetical protein
VRGKKVNKANPESPLQIRTDCLSASARVRGTNAEAPQGGQDLMLKLSKPVVAVALALTMLPGLARCDEMPSSGFVVILLDIVKPKKPDFKKPRPCAAPCCPMGMCTGARTLPCCPVAHVTAEVKVAPCPMQGPCAACPVRKPEGCAQPCCGKPCCEQAGCCKAEPALAELRALCAEQARVLREMHVMMKEMRDTINMLQVEVQQQRQNQEINSVPQAGPMPYSSQTLPYNVMPVFPEGSLNYKLPVQQSSTFSFAIGTYH